MCACNASGKLACGGACIDPNTNTDHCGSCGNDCDSVYGVCNNGSCGCVGGLTNCGGKNDCTDLAEDPANCGLCGNSCANAEICQSGACVCKPGLTLIPSVGCVDTSTNPNYCGPNQMQCSSSCENGACVNECSNSLNECNGACVDHQSNPLHCGSCNDVCQNNEVCINGDCREWVVGVGCNSCPCPGQCSGDFSQCCVYQGAINLVACVDANQCP
ncbi:MAG: hypothetical protein RIF41_36680 [Polyangiaceae bacterium]